MRALAIVLIYALLLECFYQVECEGRPVRRYQSKPPCRQPCDYKNNPCRNPCPKCKGGPWTSYVCSR
uniref:Putative 5.3 kDa protein n=1 Tax=Ixodes ricinus TaxID=34613 RepID=A0A0K8RM31_IXORI